MARAVLAALAVALAAGCGGSDPDPTGSQTAVQTTPTTTQKADAPIGKLSPDEYRDVRAAFVRLEGLEHLKAYAKVASALRAGCGKLRTDTPLVQAMDDVCDQTLRVARSIHALDAHKRECTIALNAGDVSCYSNLFRVIGRAARVTGVRQRALNAEIRRRKLIGACAKALDSSQKELSLDDAVTHDAISAAHAAERRDGDAFTRATTRLQQDFDSETGDSSSQDLRRLKSCR